MNVTSFVIDGEMFYTGVISELVPKNAQLGRSRGTSVSTMGSENHECTMKQKVYPFPLTLVCTWLYMCGVLCVCIFVCVCVCVCVCVV